VARTPNLQLTDQWRERLDRFESSELTVVQFCKQEGYSAASLYQWRRRFAQQNDRSGGAFVPVELDPTWTNPSSPSSDQAICIELPGGAVLRLGSDVPEVLLRRSIVAVVGATTIEVRS